jgi:hypothetical protein
MIRHRVRLVPPARAVVDLCEVLPVRDLAAVVAALGEQLARRVGAEPVPGDSADLSAERSAPEAGDGRAYALPRPIPEQRTRPIDRSHRNA